MYIYHSVTIATCYSTNIIIIILMCMALTTATNSISGMSGFNAAAELWTVCKSDELQTFACDNFEPSKTVHVALGSDTMLGLDTVADDWGRQNFNCAWWYSGLPDGLFNRLNGRHAELPDINHLALDASTRSNYFVQFTDRTSQWCAPDSLTQALHEEADLAIELLCFAPRNGWYAPKSEFTLLLDVLGEPYIHVYHIYGAL